MMKITPDDGFFFSAPSRYMSRDFSVNTSLYTFSPLFIPWQDIQECKKGKVWKNHTDIIMPIKNSDLSLELNHWNTLEKICGKLNKISDTHLRSLPPPRPTTPVPAR